MPTQQDLLAHFVTNSVELFLRFLPGFTEENRTAQAPHLPNHLAWTLGHLALYLNRVAELAADAPFPESDFLTGDGRQGDAKRYDTESVAYGSTPIDDPGIYPPLARGREILEKAGARLAAALRALPDEVLAERQITWGCVDLSVTDLVARISNHNGNHAGQIVDLRRALGLGGVIG
jgi:DinB superfamily